MRERVPTGITVLDRRLDGGIPAGSVVVLSAAPASQSELLLYELAAARETLYLTTLRSEEAVRDAFDRTSVRVGDPTVRSVGGDAPLDRVNRLLGTLPEDANLVVDAIDPLERTDRGRYRTFLNDLQTHVVNTGGVAYLHALDGRSVPPLRDTSEYAADVVFDLRTELTGSEVENRLAVPKFRGGRALEEAIKLRLADGVQIDTSRDIA